MHFPKEFIQKVKEENDLIEVIEEYIELKRSGAIYEALCPFHEEDTPSFKVYPNTQSFYCYGCGKGSRVNGEGSDVIAFIQEVENMTWHDAIKHLADRADLEIPKENNPKYQRMNMMIHQMENLNRDFWLNLQDNMKVMDYLKQRGITEELVNEWRIGLVPTNYPYAKVSGRLAFAIQNHNGRTVAFGYRRLNDNKDVPKYINSPESEIFKKSNILLGFDKAKSEIRKRRQAIIVEGYTDVILLHKYGAKNTVATMGTALSDYQIDILKKHCDEVIIFVDDDEPGHKFARSQVSPLHEAGLKVKIVASEFGDPADACNSMGEKIKLFIDNKAVLASQFFLERIINQYRNTVTDAQLEALKEMKCLFQIAFSPAEKDLYIKQASAALDISPKTLLEELDNLECKIQKGA